MKVRLVLLAFAQAALLAGCLGWPGPRAEGTQPNGPGPTGEDGPADAAAARGNETLSRSAAGGGGRLASVGEVRRFEARADDGIVLRGHLYLPDTPAPYATVLELSPYWNTNVGYGPSDEQAVTAGDGRVTMAGPRGKLIDAGFAVALVNPRGAGESQGCFQFGLPRDWADAYTIVETLAAQPWSNGNVGMVGLSYPGWAQFMTVAAKPPSLKAVVPVSGVIDPWNLWGRNGVPGAPQVTFGPLAWGVFGGTATTGAASGQTPPDTDASLFACTQYAPDVLANLQWGWNGDRSDYWRAMDLRPHINGTMVPTLVANGLTPGEGHILQFDGLWDLLAGPKRMFIGQWPHAYPEDEGNPEFANMTVAWLDQYLRGGPPLVASGVVEYQDAAGDWHTTDRWPPDGAGATLYLSDGRLVESADAVRASTASFQAGSPDGGAADACPNRGLDQVVYVSPPVSSDVLLAGYFEFQLTLSSNLPDGNLAATISLAKGDRACGQDVVDQARAIASASVATFPVMVRAVTDLRHARGDDAGRDFPLNTPTEVTLKSIPFAARAKTGDRFHLAIAGGHWELQPDVLLPRITVHTGPGSAGSVRFVVVEGELGFQS